MVLEGWNRQKPRCFFQRKKPRTARGHAIVALAQCGGMCIDDKQKQRVWKMNGLQQMNVLALG